MRLYWHLRADGFLICNPVDFDESMKIIDLALVRNPGLRGASWVPPKMHLVPVNKRSKGVRADIYASARLIMNRRARDRLEPLLQGHGEFLPVDVEGEELWLFNVTRVIDALDPGWVTSTEVGWNRYTFVPEKVGDAVIFQQALGSTVGGEYVTQRFAAGQYVTQRFVDAVVEAGLTGCEFLLRWDSDAPRGDEPGAAVVPVQRPEPVPVPVPDSIEGISEAEQQIFHALAHSGARLLGVDATEPPRQIVAAIDEFLADRGDEASTEELAALAALLGDQYVRELGWRRVRMHYPDGQVLDAVVDEHATLGTTPAPWLVEIADDPDHVNVLLSFNMLLAGEATPGSPGRPTLVT